MDFFGTFDISAIFTAPHPERPDHPTDADGGGDGGRCLIA
jgi:hypothetical protein